MSVERSYVLQEAILGTRAPSEIKGVLELVDLPYYTFRGSVQIGQLVVHKVLVNEVRDIFKNLCRERFPIEKMVPIVAYEWDDERSMADNNTSAFNYRTIAGTSRLSNHSFGLALDINPAFNPYLSRSGIVSPPGALYVPSRPGTVTKGGIVERLFAAHGWSWGGDWEDRKDWQHFEKSLEMGSSA